MTDVDDARKRDAWARLRFSIIGPLLAAPPADGELQEAFRALAARIWRHPLSGIDIRFGKSTLERWYYSARRSPDPVAVLKDRLRGDIGAFPSLAPRLIEMLAAQYRAHPGWTAQLHYDNLCVVLRGSEVPLPSYPTIRRYLKARGVSRGRARHRTQRWRPATGSSGWKCAASRWITSARSGTWISTTARARCSVAMATGSSHCCWA